MSDKLDELMENEVSVDLEKRKFMSKFGKYAAVSAGMAVLMNPTASSANSYGPGNPGNAKPVGNGTASSGIGGQQGGQNPD